MGGGWERGYVGVGMDLVIEHSVGMVAVYVCMLVGVAV